MTVDHFLFLDVLKLLQHKRLIECERLKASKMLDDTKHPINFRKQSNFG